MTLRVCHPRQGESRVLHFSPVLGEWGQGIPSRLVHFFSEAFDPDSTFVFDSFFDPESLSLSFDPESFDESPFPSESDFDSELDPEPPDFFA
jgi:hypothetical protein